MKQHRNLYRIEKFIVFLCIFTFPLHGIITNYMRHNPALWNNFFRSGYHIFFYDLMSFAMIFAFGSFMGIVFHICNSARKSADLKNTEITHHTMLKQQEELKNLKSTILKKQYYIDHYLHIAEQLGNEQRYEEMSSLISSLSSHVKRNYPDTFCKNALLNTLLQEKKAIADRLEINCQFRILLPESFDCVFSDITITSLFSNLLDNAIETCELCNSEEKNPFISLTTNFKANVFMIHMQNSKNPEEIFTHQTNKTQNSALHCHGLAIIEDIVTQYHGTYKWVDEGACFSCHLMLQFSEECH